MYLGISIVYYVICAPFAAFTDSEVRKMKVGRASTDEESQELKEAFRKARDQRPLATKLTSLDRNECWRHFPGLIEYV